MLDGIGHTLDEILSSVYAFETIKQCITGVAGSR